MGLYAFLIAAAIGCALTYIVWLVTKGPPQLAGPHGNRNSTGSTSGLPTYAVDVNCIICCEKESTVMFEPCNHKGLCRDCSKEYLKQTNRCPFCRRKIDNAINMS
ncbi:hypothetical protein TNCV_4545411 [Trichonephila clavipes]|nr:hypothetical protein TNCV_4545411 [Trichonephila clavipes]